MTIQLQKSIFLPLLFLVFRLSTCASMSLTPPPLGPEVTPTASATFIETLILSELSHCTLFFFQDRFDSSDSLSHIADKTNLNFYNVKYTFPLQSQISAFMETVKEFHLPSKNISIALGSPTTLPLTFPITVSNYRKKSDQCLIVILFVKDVRPQFVKQISNLMSPVYIPITRKDEDYYIFVTKEEIMDELMLMNEFPARIKFKLALAEKANNELVIRTVCFFCGFGGQPVVWDWTESINGKYMKGFEYFPDFIINLNGRILHVACPYIRARVEADAPWEGVNNARRGIWKMLFEEFLTAKFNFSYHIFVSTGKNGRFGGGGTGVQLPNGTWIGVTGDLVSGKADLGIVTANTPKRINYIDFTNSFFDIGFLTFVTSQGSRVFSPAALLWPFDLLMWFCIFLSTLVAFVFFTFLIKSIFWLKIGDSDSLNFARRGMISQQIWNFPYQFQFIMTSFLDQDCVMPTFSPLRCFCAIWLFFTLIITTLYRAKMTSLLAFPILEIPPADFDQLAYSDYEVGFMKHGDSAYNTLRASTDAVYVKLLKEMEIINGVGLECLFKVVGKKYGCIGYDFALRHLQDRNLTESDTRKLIYQPAHTYNIFLGIATEGKSIYRLNFGKWLSLTRAFHLPDIWEVRDMYYTVKLLKRQWWMDTNQTEKLSKTVEAEGDNLTLQHVAGSFYVLHSLLGISLMIFWIELLHFNRSKLGNKGSKIWNNMKILCDRAFVLKRRTMDEYT